MVTHAELLRQAAAGPTVARVAGTIAAVDQRKSARGTRFAFVRLSDPTGLYEVRVFSDVLDAARDHLEPGRSVVLTVEATVEGDELRLLARHVQPIDAAVAGAGDAGLRVYLDDAAAAAPSLAARLDQIGRDPGSRKRGPIELVVMAPDLPGETMLVPARQLPPRPVRRRRAEERPRRRLPRGVLIGRAVLAASGTWYVRVLHRQELPCATSSPSCPLGPDPRGPTAARAAELRGQDDPRFRAALALWLADDDETALPELAALAAEGNRAAQVMLAQIDATPWFQGPWLVGLPRKRAERALARPRRPLRAQLDAGCR